MAEKTEDRFVKAYFIGEDETSTLDYEVSNVSAQELILLITELFLEFPIKDREIILSSLKKIKNNEEKVLAGTISVS